MPDSFQPFEMPARRTLVECAADALTAQLDSGRWRQFLPGERELSRELQISRPTLRHALRVLERAGRLQVAHGRRRQILLPRKVGKVLGGRRTVMGLLSPLPLKLLPPFVLFWVDEVRSHLAKVGYRLEFHASHACSTARPQRALERLVHGSPTSGWILLLSSPPVQQWFTERNLPFVIAGSCTESCPAPSVDIDYRAACTHAVGVFRRRGHQRLALVVPSTGLVGDSESEAGIAAGCAGGVAPLIIRHNGTREDIIRRLEASQAATSPPTGFLVGRSSHVLTVLTWLLRRRFDLPNQAALISRDQDSFLEFVTPQIARYRTDPATFARHLSHLILRLVRSGSAPLKPVRLMPEFQKGETV